MGERLSVLVVDDNRELAENIAEILEFDNIRCRIATSGRAALALLEDERFQLVITDVRMPGMNGIELLRQIRRDFPAMPIIVMSAYSSDAVLEEAAIEGALDILVKPLDFVRITDLVSRVAEPMAQVLVVEDNDALRVAVSECLLELAGVVPYPARDIASARQLMEQVQFRMAIVDLRLPDGDGLALGCSLDENATEPFAVVFVTAFLADSHAELEFVMHERETVKLLEKPFMPSRLLDMVSSIVTRRAEREPEPDAG